MDSLSSFWDALVAFGGALGSVSVLPLILALLCHLIALILRGVAWRNILQAGVGGEPIPGPPVVGALIAGTGLNGIVPARGGDVLKLFLVHSKVPRTTYPMLASSLIPETLFNSMMALLLLLWAWQLGVLPSFPELPGLSAFEISWAARYPEATGIVIILLIALLAAIAIIQRPRLERMWSDIRDGLSVLGNPPLYFKTVVSIQASAWVVRVAAAWFFLDAFGIDPSVRNALIVVMVQGVSSALPLTPGGVGPKQALLVVLFAGDAAQSTVLAFSVGMEIATVLFQLVIAILISASMLNGFNIKAALREARAQRAAAESRM